MLQFFLRIPSKVNRYYTHSFDKNTGKTDWFEKIEFLKDNGFVDIGPGDQSKESVPWAYDLSKMRELEYITID
jgi:hypothetical protein